MRGGRCPGVESPYDRVLGFRCLEAADGVAVYEADVDETMHNPVGAVHGGVLCGLADAAMGAAFLTVSGQGTNMDLSIRFLRPAAGRLRATAQIIKRGRRVSLLRCDIHDAEGRMVATADSQFMD